MEIINKEVISNYEVLQCLRYNKKYRADHPESTLMEDSAILDVEKKVRNYLNSTPAHTQRREDIELYLHKIAKFNLSKPEKLQLVNLKPKKPVDLYLIIPTIEERLTQEEIDELLALTSD